MVSCQNQIFLTKIYPNRQILQQKLTKWTTLRCILKSRESRNCFAQMWQVFWYNFSWIPLTCLKREFLSWNIFEQISHFKVVWRSIFALIILFFSPSPCQSKENNKIMTILCSLVSVESHSLFLIKSQLYLSVCGETF